MQNFQKEKQLVLNYYEALNSSSKEGILQICDQYLADHCIWQSYHPFKDQSGFSEIAHHFWIPFKTSFSRLQRRQDIFFAGRNIPQNIIILSLIYFRFISTSADLLLSIPFLIRRLVKRI